MIENILSGCHVVDLTQNVAGPFCTQILGDFGAEVIKVERPRGGDDTRAWLPPSIGDQASIFLALNRNKKSICLDLDTAEGVQVMHKLVASADIVIHSFKPGSAEARGLGFNDLRRSRPDLIYCAISAFGENGPLRGMPGYDPLMQAFTGIMSVTGNPESDAVRVPVSLIDMGTGLWAALGIVGAALHRTRTGEGMLVGANLMDTGLSWMTVFIASYLATGTLPEKLGSAMAMTVPYELFPTSDGRVFIAAGNDRLFARVCEALGCPELAIDNRFDTNARRVVRRSQLHALLTARTTRMTTQAAVAALRKLGAPCSELNNLSQVLAHEQVAAAEMLMPLPVAGAPQHKAVALPLSLNGKRSTARMVPPGLGEHTDEVLSGRGFTAHQIGVMRQRGVIA
jgi:crotonobetainyl-CoA:carnitine CoA-transferase CaiB-like acyl-CoA transferase